MDKAGEDDKAILHGKGPPAGEEVDRKRGTDRDGPDSGPPPLGKGEGNVPFSGAGTSYQGYGHPLAVGTLQPDQERGQKALGVADPQPEGGRHGGEDFLGREQFRGESLDVEHPGQAGDGHEGQKPRHHQEQQVVAGVDGGETEQQGDDDVQRPGLADPQAKGSAMSAMHFRGSSPW